MLGQREPDKYGTQTLQDIVDDLQAQAASSNVTLTHFQSNAEFELIADDQTILEGRPLEQAAQMGELVAYQHNGFWQCMDTKRDKDILEKSFKEKKYKI